MSYESRAYDEPARDGFGPDPVVVLVVKGTHDVSRLVHLFSRGLVEQVGVGRRIQAQVRRDGGGRAALRLLAQHGGPNFSAPERLTRALTPKVREVISAILAGKLMKHVARKDQVSQTAIAHRMLRAREVAGAVSNEQLIAWAVHYGLVTPPPLSREG